MPNPLLTILTGGISTQRDAFPDLPEAAPGLPRVTRTPCEGAECGQCADVCPTQAIRIAEDAEGGVVALDRGRCIGCAACFEACPSGTLVPDRSTRTAVRSRESLVLTNRPAAAGPESGSPPPSPFRRSLHIREVSTGCSATDLEVAATTNPIFDVARYGVHFVASPRFADALLVTGPVGRAMQGPLRRCYDAMAEPRLVIAAGTCAISGGLHRGGYAHANGLEVQATDKEPWMGDPSLLPPPPSALPVAVYVPGCPPHPWSIINGILLAMGWAD